MRASWSRFLLRQRDRYRYNRAALRLYLHWLLVTRSPPAAWLRARDLAIFLRVRRHTMISVRRMFNLFDLLWRLDRRSVPGALVECGVWRGGAAAALAYLSQRWRSGRSVWLFDSFVGLPEASARDEADVSHIARGQFGGSLRPVGALAAPRSDAERLLYETLALDPGFIRIAEGWFQETLPLLRSEVGPIALLRLDGDYYESTRVCLDLLYAQVAPGGYVIIDDYATYRGCRRAVDEFLATLASVPPLRWIDEHAVCFQKP